MFNEVSLCSLANISKNEVKKLVQVSFNQFLRNYCLSFWQIYIFLENINFSIFSYFPDRSSFGDQCQFGGFGRGNWYNSSHSNRNSRSLQTKRNHSWKYSREQTSRILGQVEIQTSQYRFWKSPTCPFITIWTDSKWTTRHSTGIRLENYLQRNIWQALYRNKRDGYDVIILQKCFKIFQLFFGMIRKPKSFLLLRWGGFGYSNSDFWIIVRGNGESTEGTFKSHQIWKKTKKILVWLAFNPFLPRHNASTGSIITRITTNNLFN